jgi:hypothetical protein
VKTGAAIIGALVAGAFTGYAAVIAWVRVRERTERLADPTPFPDEDEETT